MSRNPTRTPTTGRRRRARAPVLRALSPLATLAATLLIGVAASAQQVPQPPARANPADLPLDSKLYAIEQMVRTDARAFTDIRAELEQRGYVLDAADRIHVDIARPEGLDTPLAGLLAAHGTVLDRHVPGRADAWVPLDRLTELARAMPVGNFIHAARELNYDDVTGEGPAAVNSDSYISGGADGGGIRIAVIDGGFSGFSAARTNGDIPSAGSTTTINYTPFSFESGGTHGTGCVEAAFDHAPGSTWRIYKVDSATDVSTAVTNSIANGVDIISMSLSWYNYGWADNSGTLCAAANNAAANGILFFTSAGNRAESHCQQTFADSDTDNWCDFSPGDETIDLSVANGGDVNLYLAWNTSGGTYNYDLYLYDSTITTVLASSTNSGNTFEDLEWDNFTGSTQTVHIAILKQSGGNTTFEIFDHNGGTWSEHITAANSTTSPSNSTNLNVISVAAVDEDNYGSAPGTNPVESYSSRGPSNGGTTKPDLTGPTDTTGYTYPFGFGGTSSATPNAAGAAAAFWSADTLLQSSGVRWLLFEQSDLLRDWGTNGNDNTYGNGGIQFLDYQANTIWIDRDFGNVTNLRQWPFYTLQAAHDAAVSGGRLLAIGASNYPETATLNKFLTLETAAGTKTFGN